MKHHSETLILLLLLQLLPLLLLIIIVITLWWNQARGLLAIRSQNTIKLQTGPRWARPQTLIVGHRPSETDWEKSDLGHYENAPFKYIEITSKNWRFSDKKKNKLWYFSYFCSKHRLWVLVRTPRRGVSNEYHNRCFWAEIRKIMCPI